MASSRAQVLDAERLRARQRDVVLEAGELSRLLGAARLGQGSAVGGARRAVKPERVCPRHHVNGVDEELRGDARFALVLAEAEQAQTRNDHHRRVRIAQLRRIRQRVRLVVGRVVLAIRDQPLVHARLQLGHPFGGRIPRHVEGRDARAQEMIRTAGAQLAQRFRPRRIRKRDRIGAALEVSDDPAVRGHGATQHRQNRHRQRIAIRRGRDACAAERRPAGAIRVRLHELTHLIDGPDAADVALLLRLTPREQPVTSEDDPVASRVLLDRTTQHQRQLESGPLPGHPRDLSPVRLIELVELLFAVGAGRQRNRPIRMQVIDVRKRQKRVQRRVDRRGNPVLAERAQRVEPHHLVLVRFAAIARDQIVQLVHVEHGETGRADRSEIAAAPFHGHHAARLARQGVRQIELGARVAAAKVGDAQVGAEQVRSIPQQLQRCGLEGGALTIVPEILQRGSHGLRRRTVNGWGFRHR